jgi:hypothetical protein
MAKKLTEAEKIALRDRHHRDQISTVSPQGLRKLQAKREPDGSYLYDRRQRREYLRRAERLERESGQR